MLAAQNKEALENLSCDGATCDAMQHKSSIFGLNAVF
jgi:hypothetical protein